MRCNPTTTALLAALAAASSVSAQCEPVWTLVGGANPGGRFVSAGAHDPSRNVDIIFGGAAALTGGTFYGDTWEFDRASGTWSERAPAGPAAPSARYGVAGTFLGTAGGGDFVIFGGSTLESGLGVQSDTWRWDGSAWTQVFTPVAPSPRYGAAMSYDHLRQRVVLFGGFIENNSVSGETWEFDGATWTYVGAGPAPRGYASMAFDSARGRTVLFGGHTGGVSPIRYNDTWEWDGTWWQQASPAAMPAERLAAAMGYDAAAQHMVLFGGLGAGLPDDLWTFDGAWESHPQPAVRPTGRAGAVSAMDAAGEFMIHGGFDGAAVSSETWLLRCQPAAPACYANCDQSTTPPVLNVADFTCFLQRFAAGESYANCDQSTAPPTLNVADFTCFLQSFAGGCR